MPSQLEYYIQAQQELVSRHRGKIIAVVDGVCQGEYPSKTEAMYDMLAKGHKPGAFLIILCNEGDGEYTRRFRSRVTPMMGQTAWANL